MRNKSTGKRLALLSALFGLGLAAMSAAGARAQAFVIDGETIADADLFKAAKAEGMLVYYTVNFEDMERATLDRFKALTGINYEVIRLAGGRMYERVTTEFSGGRLQADLVSLTDFVLMNELVAKGALVSYRIPWWDVIPANLKHADARYYTQNRFAKILGYNTKRWSAAEAPKKWADLLNPKFKGEIGIQEANAGGISWTTALFQRKVVDPQYWSKMAANTPKLYNGLTPLAEDVARGELTVGEMTVGLVKNLLDSGAPMGVSIPTEGVPASPIHVGLTSVAKNPSAAKLYINYVLSKAGGKTITEIFFDWPSHPDVPPPSLPKYNIQLPPSSALYLASPDDWVNLKDSWLKEWDAALRVRK